MAAQPVFFLQQQRLSGFFSPLLLPLQLKVVLLSFITVSTLNALYTDYYNCLILPFSRPLNKKLPIPLSLQDLLSHAPHISILCFPIPPNTHFSSYPILPFLSLMSTFPLFPFNTLFLLLTSFHQSSSPFLLTLYTSYPLPRLGGRAGALVSGHDTHAEDPLRRTLRRGIV